MSAETEAFDRAFGLIVEGACPADGARLERREGWGFAFCITCGEGWQAGTGERRYIHRRSGRVSWSEGGSAWTTSHELLASNQYLSRMEPSAELLPAVGVSG